MLRSRVHALIAGLIFVASSCCASALPAEAVVAYVFPQEDALQPGQIDAHALTRINYAFANIQNGLMVPGFAKDKENFALLTSLRRQNPSLTVLVSVGGWEWSNNFSDVALTPQSRAVFIASVMEFLARYDLDGLDIDWEYPGLAGAGHKFRKQDKQNFTALLTELRERFTAETGKSHRRLYLTIASGASDEYLDHTDMANVERYVDTVNLMAYDYYEPSDDKVTGHHAPLYTNPQDKKRASADASVLAFEKAGVPAAKLLLGLPFYGHVWAQVGAQNHGLFQPGKPMPEGYAPYSAITSTMLNHGFERYWDPAASVPWLYNSDKRIFVSYEDPESIAAKCHYVLSHKLGGVMFWDYAGDPSETLLNAIHDSLRSQPSKSSPAR